MEKDLKNKILETVSAECDNFEPLYIFFMIPHYHGIITNPLKVTVIK